MRGLTSFLLIALLGFAATSPGLIAQEPDLGREPLVERVRAAIDKGVRYLRNTEKDNRAWERDVASIGMQGGQSALALLALQNAGACPRGGRRASLSEPTRGWQEPGPFRALAR